MKGLVPWRGKSYGCVSKRYTPLPRSLEPEPHRIVEFKLVFPLVGVNVTKVLRAPPVRLVSGAPLATNSRGVAIREGSRHNDVPQWEPGARWGAEYAGENSMKRRILLVLAALALAFLAGGQLSAHAQTDGQKPPSAPHAQPAPWKFAVSGDSRNCGDVVMPAIAGRVRQSGALFYWHLGDFRKMTGPDEDIQHQPEHRAAPLSEVAYRELAWKDFLDSQIAPFGSVPVYLGIGNHETARKTRPDFMVQFRDWLDAPNLRAQRLRDDPHGLDPKTYYHWTEDGVDFINLDNATEEQFDADQIAWLEKTLRSDMANRRIRAIVVGMHEALPESLGKNHSMNQSAAGIESGRRVYADLLRARRTSHKRVYVLASHSHYFMDGIFNTDYWKQHGGVLPGWIVGTAGAARYALPEESAQARAAETNVYGFLTGTVQAHGNIVFAFERVNEPEVPAAVVARYTPEFVHWCFAENSAAH